SPNGRTLAIGGDAPGVRLWDAGAGRQTVTLDTHGMKVAWLAFAPNGKSLACALGATISGKLWGELDLWYMAARTQVVILREANRRVSRIAFSPDGRFIA